MKRAIFAILGLFLAISFCAQVSAVELDRDIVTINNTDVIFDTSSSLTEEEKQLVAEYILYGSSDTQSYGLMCNLFGHKNTTEIVTTITHCVRTAVPRCLEEKWELIICSRCDNVDNTRIAYSYIDCCPVD